MYKWTTILCLMVLSACQKDLPKPDQTFTFALPGHFPQMEIPVDNEFSHSRWELGKALFYDTRLSADGRVSCSSCHRPELAFSDDLKVSLGSDMTPGRSNAPPLFNLGYHPYFTRAGGVPTLEMQILVPIQEHDEFNSNIVEIANRLSDDAELQQLSEASYARALDPFVITRALANFERTLVSGNSPYDRYVLGDQNALSNLEKEGLQLFSSPRLACAECHSGILFSDFSFQNNGLYENYKDNGRRRFTGMESDEALFKVPSLRNIEVTAPYMHDGSMFDLDEVIAHYNKGGRGHFNQSHLVKPLNLTNQEQLALKAFLISLTDDDFLLNKFFVKDE